MNSTERSWSDEPTTRSLPATFDRKMIMIKNSKARTVTVFLATGSAVLMATGIGYAFWSTTGSGTGTAGAGTPNPVVISQTGVANPADLVPNGVGAVGVKIDNTVSGGNGNAYSVQLTKVNTVSVVSSDTGACPSTNVIANQTLPYTLPAAIVVGGNASMTATIAALVKMLNTAPDGCQGKTFAVTLTMS